MNPDSAPTATRSNASSMSSERFSPVTTLQPPMLSGQNRLFLSAGVSALLASLSSEMWKDQIGPARGAHDLCSGDRRRQPVRCRQIVAELADLRQPPSLRAGTALWHTASQAHHPPA